MPSTASRTTSSIHIDRRDNKWLIITIIIIFKVVATRNFLILFISSHYLESRTKFMSVTSFLLLYIYDVKYHIFNDKLYIQDILSGWYCVSVSCCLLDYLLTLIYTCQFCTIN